MIKKILSSLAVTALLFSAHTALFAAPSTSYTEYAETGEPPASNPTSEVRAAYSGKLGPGVLLYDSLADFNASVSDIIVEDFSSTLVPPNGVAGCLAPIDSTTSSVCFNAGTLAPGFSINAFTTDANAPNNDTVVVTPSFVGVTSVSVGANFFAHNTVIDFNPPMFAAAFNIVNPLVSMDTTVEIFDSNGNSLGTTNVSTPADGTGTFFGVSATNRISRITLVEGAGGGELISNLRFSQMECELNGNDFGDDLECIAQQANRFELCNPVTNTANPQDFIFAAPFLNLAVDTSSFPPGDFATILINQECSGQLP